MVLLDVLGAVVVLDVDELFVVDVFDVLFEFIGRFDCTEFRDAGVGVDGEAEVEGCLTGAFAPGVGAAGVALDVVEEGAAAGPAAAGPAAPVDWLTATEQYSIAANVVDSRMRRMEQTSFPDIPMQRRPAQACSGAACSGAACSYMLAAMSKLSSSTVPNARPLSRSRQFAAGAGSAKR